MAKDQIDFSWCCKY